MIGSVLGSVIPTLIAIIGGAFYIGDRLGSLETKVEDNQRELTKLKEALDCDQDSTGGDE